MRPISIEASTISDAWFQLIYSVLDDDKIYETNIQRGSFAEDKKTGDKGQIRRQFPGCMIYIKHPDKDIVPIMPAGLGIPPPTDMDYIENYFATYLMRAELYPNEQYTYGQRIAISLDEVIKMLNKTPFSNQCNLQIGEPKDIFLPDPPCLRIMDLKVLPGKPERIPCKDDDGISDFKWEMKDILTMSVYFRSWDLWAGLPANLGGFELLKQYICQETGLMNGPMYAYSAGLHLYSMYEEVARIRAYK